MHVTNLELRDFRCYPSATLELPAAVTVVTGDNGQGKTSLLEAVAWLALGRSFRGVADPALIRDGADQAIVRAAVHDAGRTLQVDAELRRSGRPRILLNGQAVARARDLTAALRVTVFAPDDLQLVKGGPGERRAYLDDLLTSSVPRYSAVRADLDRVLRHRNALLRGGLRDQEARDTLVVFDEQLVAAAAELVRGRLGLLTHLTPAIDAAYRSLAPDGGAVDAVYEAEWSETTPPSTGDVVEQLRGALERRRRQEVDRGVTLVGPHRDEWRLSIEHRDSRTHASQGEQRTLALALRLGAHRVLAEVVGHEPALLLDDVFSELDRHRARALVDSLPDEAQTVVTTAGAVPTGIVPSLQLHVDHGRVSVVGNGT